MFSKGISIILLRSRRGCEGEEAVFLWSMTVTKLLYVFGETLSWNVMQLCTSDELDHVGPVLELNADCVKARE